MKKAEEKFKKGNYIFDEFDDYVFKSGGICDGFVIDADFGEPHTDIYDDELRLATHDEINDYLGEKIWGIPKEESKSNNEKSASEIVETLNTIADNITKLANQLDK